MSNVNLDVVKETMDVCGTPFNADELFQNSKADGLPVPYHQCKAIAEISEQCIKAGGFYNIFIRAGEKGSTLVFFDRDGNLTHNITMNAPVIARDRKIPKLNWLKGLFKAIGYDETRIEIKYIHRIIDSHIRDGGSWTSRCNDSSIAFTLLMNGQIKSHMEFHREVFE